MENCNLNHEDPVKSNEKKCIDLASSDLIEIPPDLLTLTDHSVRRLYVDYNELSVLPPDVSCLWPNLEVISANGNQLNYLPESLASLQHLCVLELVENNLVSMPSSICELKTLETIRLTGNNLKHLPEKFSDISGLKCLHVEENCLRSLPSSLGDLKNLTVLEASHNQLQHLPDSIGNLVKLEVLNISNNHICMIPESFCHLANLIHIDLSVNGIEYLPMKFGSIGTLQTFYAECNLLKALPDWVNQLSVIKEFSVRDNHLPRKPLSESFGKNCGKLILLNIAGNFMSDLPESLGNLTCLEELHMGSVIDELERRNFQNGNWIAHLPANFGQLINLRELHLDENQLREIPSDIGNLSQLEFFDIGQNMVQDIPDSFCKLKKLRVCQLSRNSIERLPENFGDLESLEDLRLDHNQVCELPESFNKLSKLKSLDLFNNKLTEIPPAVLELTLVRLDMGENKFQIPWHKVPLLTKKNRYAPRKPELKDNWRGKMRPDVIYDEAEEKMIVIEALDLPDEDEDEELTEDAPYSAMVMKRAAERGLSFWRSHDGPETRPVYSPTTAKPSLDEIIIQDEDDGWISDNEEDDDQDSEEILNREKKVSDDQEHVTEIKKTNSDNDNRGPNNESQDSILNGDLGDCKESGCVNDPRNCLGATDSKIFQVKDQMGVPQLSLEKFAHSECNSETDRCRIDDHRSDHSAKSDNGCEIDQKNKGESAVSEDRNLVHRDNDRCESESDSEREKTHRNHQNRETKRDGLADSIDVETSSDQEDTASCEAEDEDSDVQKTQENDDSEWRTTLSEEEDWDEEIDNNLGPYEEIKTYQHPPRDHIIMCHEIRNHYFPAWDIHAKPVDWLKNMVEPQIVDGQFDDCEDDTS